jgi:hypothetical protein
MKTIKSLVLGSAAGLLAMGGAQAADLPVKAKAVEYVKVCSLYGAGFFYIPGTDTCIKLGGYLRVDTSFNTAGVQDQPAWNGDPGQMNRYRDYFSTRSRLALTVDMFAGSSGGRQEGHEQTGARCNCCDRGDAFRRRARSQL